MISEILEHGPAAHAGTLFEKDELVEVDGEDLYFGVFVIYIWWEVCPMMRVLRVKVSNIVHVDKRRERRTKVKFNL